MPDLRLGREGHMDSHLVSVKVRVVRMADKRMELYRFFFNQYRFEGLDAEAVKSGSAVEQHRVSLDNIFKDAPYKFMLRLNHSLGRLDIMRVTLFDKPSHDKRLE